MPEKLEGQAGKSKTWIFGAIGVLILLAAACFCGAFAMGVPAFHKYVNKSKALEAERQVQSIALGAKAHFASECSFPEAAGPLPPLLDCCEDVCRRDEAQMSEPGWEAVGFDTRQQHRFEYETVKEPDVFIVRARADLDCDGERSLYELELQGDRNECTATIGELEKESPFE